jgi:isocitrate/isopropylmalate dehydrogenase
MAAILTAGMMLDELGFPEESAHIEKVVVEAIRQGITTPDLGGELGTHQVAEWIRTRL